MSNVPTTTRLIFVGTYAEVADLPPGTATKVLRKFGQEFDAPIAVATRLLSIEEGTHRVAPFVTESEFKSIEDSPDKKAKLWAMLHTPGTINAPKEEEVTE